MTFPRHFTLATFAVLLSLSGCERDAAGPGPDSTAGVRFDDGDAIHAAHGSPHAGGILDLEFAVARADSVGGFVLVSYDRTQGEAGNLFVLQAPRATRSFECALHAGPCHGRYIIGVRDGSTVTADRWFHVTDGTLEVTQIGPDRLRGSFRLTLDAMDGKPDAIITAENGTFDVPWIAGQVTDGALACLLLLVGMGDGPCAG